MPAKVSTSIGQVKYTQFRLHGILQSVGPIPPIVGHPARHAAISLGPGDDGPTAQAVATIPQFPHFPAPASQKSSKWRRANSLTPRVLISPTGLYTATPAFTVLLERKPFWSAARDDSVRHAEHKKTKSSGPRAPRQAGARNIAAPPRYRPFWHTPRQAGQAGLGHSHFCAA